MKCCRRNATPTWYPGIQPPPFRSVCVRTQTRKHKSHKISIRQTIQEINWQTFSLSFPFPAVFPAIFPSQAAASHPAISLTCPARRLSRAICSFSTWKLIFDNLLRNLTQKFNKSGAHFGPSHMTSTQARGSAPFRKSWEKRKARGLGKFAGRC